MIRLTLVSLSLLACNPAENAENSETGFQGGENQEAPSQELGPDVNVDTQAADVVAAVPDLFEVVPGEEQVAFLAFTSCLDLKTKNPEAPSGKYQLYQRDEAGQLTKFDAHCDMDEDGGWTMVLNYVHLGGTNPPTQTLTDRFPQFDKNNLGDDEQNTEFFGHVNPAFLSLWTFTELRFFCRTNAHNRVIHFKTDAATCIDYLKTGVGNCDDVRNSFTPLTGHIGDIPGVSNNGLVDQQQLAMTQRTFRDNNGTRNWDIRGGVDEDDWECDDDVDNQSSSTIHRIWFR
ncbi:fibrinogen-like YCDxxxxGGGW domain-containing protein [Pseudobacteriovorax antillogorgiicola]|uniref:Fibrinogen C-terminal domain-containing protein n=1 Tax=Pseudobacteriovorax antillogorgiicola TaxID=1513793 RepID=A0A1Y6BYF0_9BACT|nr:fibrinogen-like YCDxxxxGGGW domain-containing protein [Pseudobacteriovorax antillogorgiicola]TCS51288.1 hypothetical protein EDD56_111173 [Pseudobacteriovorax antillogorgiicola]SMF36131.1 hypothetical protein SAMN06296036_1115 [Pseudobacteriovorax antillogorgiicola]